MTSFPSSGKIENVGFPEAVRIVAQKCGIPLPKREFSSPEEAAEARLRGKLLDLHEAATAWFEEQLRGPEGALAREYLAGRGLDAEGNRKIPDRLRAGQLSCPAGPAQGHGGRRRHCGRAGFSARKSRETARQGPLYDRFRKRVMFPIANESGRVIAFTARTLEYGRQGRREVHQLAGDAALYQGSRPIQPRQGQDCDPPGRSLPCWLKGRWTVSASICAGFRT